MLPLVILLLWLGVSALIFYAWAKRRKARMAAAASGDAGEGASSCGSHDGICCGMHDVCEKGLPKRTPDLYFDDEELDRYAGRKADSYTPDEIEEFREVILTTLPEERAKWLGCLGRRGITPPREILKELQ